MDNKSIIDELSDFFHKPKMEKLDIIIPILKNDRYNNFIEIARISANNKPSKYLYDDKVSAPGIINYYKIVSIEQNGLTNNTNIYPLGANEGEVLIASVYPNPVINSFNISFDSKVNTSMNINIYNTFGKLVKSFNKNITTGDSSFNLNIEDLNSGIYLLETINSNNQVVSKQKLIKIDR